MDLLAAEAEGAVDTRLDPERRVVVRDVLARLRPDDRPDHETRGEQGLDGRRRCGRRHAAGNSAALGARSSPLATRRGYGPRNPKTPPWQGRFVRVGETEHCANHVIVVAAPVVRVP